MRYGIDLRFDEYVAEAGGRFSGEARRDPQPEDGGDPIRGLRLELHYRTEGRGNTDRHVASRVEIPTKSDGSISSRFELVVPEAGPVSYDGRLVRITWAVEARLDVKMRPDHSVHASVLVVPAGGFGVYDRPHPLRRV